MPAASASATTEMRTASAVTAAAAATPVTATTTAVTTATAAAPSGCRRRTSRCGQSDRQNNNRADFEFAHDILGSVDRSHASSSDRMPLA